MTPYTIKVRRDGFALYVWSLWIRGDLPLSQLLLEVGYGWAFTRRQALRRAKRSARKMHELIDNSNEETFTYDPAEEAK